ncbi:PIN domain-containing protein [Caminibacter sp.]
MDKIVIDTNIVFSAFLGNSKIREFLMCENNRLFVPKIFFVEMFIHKEKLTKISKLSLNEVNEFLLLITKNLIVFDDKLIPESIKAKALKIVEDIDIKDLLFIALSLYLDAKIFNRGIKS